FNESFIDSPVFLADMQTTDGSDTATVRWENKDPFGVEVKIEEEQSRDSETRHTTEMVGYMVFSLE
ncbi:MAG: fibronectin type III domain-containing protein, partial [Deltaproteobacteria bacterium]|nr:fibronectin type III domain-containing protein [Deltaproteobacteria bacterium]